MSKHSNIKTREKQGYCMFYSDLSKNNLRQKLKRDLAKEPLEPEYDEREYIEPCDDMYCNICFYQYE